jgi:hypothetical protein
MLIETLHRPSSGETALVVARGEDVQILPTWEHNGVTYRPVAPSHNLIKHRALLFPEVPAAYADEETLLQDIADYITTYVVLSPEELGIASAYVLLSWVYDAFNELPYLRFRGDYGTGKTRALIVVGSLCYKAFFASGASTVSPIFHTLDTFKGTLIFDEADFRFTDEKAELVKILNNGNAKGFPVLRTHVTPKHEFDPRAFEIYGPKIVGMRRSYEDRALESRFLTIDMPPGRASGVPINLPERQRDEALVLRNKLLMYRLRNRLSTAIDPSLACPELEPRLNQVLLPVLSVVPVPRVRADILARARSIQNGLISERAGSPEGHAIAIVSGLLRDDPSERVPLSAIVQTFVSAHGGEYDRPITHRWMGALLRRLGLVLYKTNGVFALSPGQLDRVAALVERYGVGDSAEKRVDSGPPGS